MRDFEDHDIAVARAAKPRQPAFRLTDLRQRLTRTLIGSEAPSSRGPDLDLDNQLQETQPLEWDRDMPRFAVVRHGYHCASVDEYVSDLERELGELDQELIQLRTQVSRPAPAPEAPAPARHEVEAEIKRVGEQTSAVLIAAHEQAQECVREAEAEAERTLSDAKSRAASIVCDANQRLHELEREMDAVRAERDRLLGDVRSAAAALNELVEVSLSRIPSPVHEPEPAEAAQHEPEAETEVESDPEVGGRREAEVDLKADAGAEAETETAPESELEAQSEPEANRPVQVESTDQPDEVEAGWARCIPPERAGARTSSGGRGRTR